MHREVDTMEVLRRHLSTPRRHTLKGRQLHSKARETVSIHPRTQPVKFDCVFDMFCSGVVGSVVGEIAKSASQPVRPKRADIAKIASFVVSYVRAPWLTRGRQQQQPPPPSSPPAWLSSAAASPPSALCKFDLVSDLGYTSRRI